MKPSLSTKLKAGLTAAVVASSAVFVASCAQLCGPSCGSKKEQVNNTCGATKQDCGAAENK